MGDWGVSCRQFKRDEFVLCLARIGSTHLTRSYILNKDPSPQCEYYQRIVTVRYMLVECNHSAQESMIYLVKEMRWNHLDSSSH